MRIDTFIAQVRPIICSFSLLLIILLTGKPLWAHVEKGAMPDSVAEMEYRILLEFTPQDVPTRSLLGMALLRQGKLSDAEKEFRQILQNDPKYFDALDGLGLVMLKQKRNSEALRHLLTAVKIRPDDILVHLHLGLALAGDSQIEVARETLATGLELLDKHPPSSTRDRQLAEFKAAMAKLPKRTTAVPLH